jgi:hypothetical protein
MTYRTKLLIRVLLYWALLGVIAVLLLGYYASEKLKWGFKYLGPYPCQQYSGTLPNVPDSRFQVKGNWLELHKTLDSRGPILVLRNSNGIVLWSRLLVPSEVIRGKEYVWHIKGIDFKDAKIRSSGSEVYVLCDWNHGGIESGIILLGPDFSFKGIGISW